MKLLVVRQVGIFKGTRAKIEVTDPEKTQYLLKKLQFFEALNFLLKRYKIRLQSSIIHETSISGEVITLGGDIFSAQPRYSFPDIFNNAMPQICGVEYVKEM